MFFVVWFLHIDFQITRWYEHVSGRLCSDTSNCRYINAVVIEHYYSSHRNASMHNQRLLLALTAQLSQLSM